MKKMNSPLKLALLTFSFLFILTSCGKDNDNTPPSVTVVNSTPDQTEVEVCGELEENGYEVFSGDTLYLELLIEDNEQLSEMKLDIHNNFDCHGHGGGQAPGFDPPAVANQTADWTILDIRDLEGSSQQPIVGLPVPANVTAGTYHFGIQVLDAAGNESTSGTVFDINAINLNDTIPPDIEMQQPSGGELQLSRGEMIEVSGSIKDNRALEEGGNAIVFLSYKKKDSGNHFTGPYHVFQQGAGEEEAFNLEFEFPQSVTTGDYQLFVNAHDGVRNIAEVVVYEVELTE